MSKMSRCSLSRQVQEHEVVITHLVTNADLLLLRTRRGPKRNRGDRHGEDSQLYSNAHMRFLSCGAVSRETVEAYSREQQSTTRNCVCRSKIRHFFKGNFDFETVPAERLRQLARL